MDLSGTDPTAGPPVDDPPQEGYDLRSGRRKSERLVARDEAEKARKEEAEKARKLASFSKIKHMIVREDFQATESDPELQTRTGRNISEQQSERDDSQATESDPELRKRTGLNVPEQRLERDDSQAIEPDPELRIPPRFGLMAPPPGPASRAFRPRSPPNQFITSRSESEDVATGKKAGIQRKRASSQDVSASDQVADIHGPAPNHGAREDTLRNVTTPIASMRGTPDPVTSRFLSGVGASPTGSKIVSGALAIGAPIEHSWLNFEHFDVDPRGNNLADSDDDAEHLEPEPEDRTFYRHQLALPEIVQDIERVYINLMKIVNTLQVSNKAAQNFSDHSRILQPQQETYFDAYESNKARLEEGCEGQMSLGISPPFLGMQDAANLIYTFEGLCKEAAKSSYFLRFIDDNLTTKTLWGLLNLFCFFRGTVRNCVLSEDKTRLERDEVDMSKHAKTLVLWKEGLKSVIQNLLGEIIAFDKDKAHVVHLKQMSTQRVSPKTIKAEEQSLEAKDQAMKKKLLQAIQGVPAGTNVDPRFEIYPGLSKGITAEQLELQKQLLP